VSLSRILPVFPLAGTVLLAQLTMEQKVADFQYMASLYAKRYGPYEWKRDVVNFDLLNIGPWLTRINATRDDLQFFDVMSAYVSSLNDAHDTFTIPANFLANLNFSVDVYDGALLVDSISRTRLPASEFPFLIGYELVSIDGVDAQKILDGLLRYEMAANPRSTRRLAAQLLTLRPQVLIPTAANVPEISTVVFRRPDRVLETYRIPWSKSGVPLTNVGRYPTWTGSSGSGLDEQDSYTTLLRRLQNCRLPDHGYDRTVLGFGSRTPVFASALTALGDGFTQRLGKVMSDTFYSGVFQHGPYKIGFIRIPDYAPSNPQMAMAQFKDEVAFFQANTDGLIVDEMRNPGGSVSYTNALLSLLIPYTWNSVGFEIRATSEWVLQISSALEQAKTAGAPSYIIALLQSLKEVIQTANSENRGRTGPIPLDDVTIDRSPAMDKDGNVIAYTKPLMVLVDEMSASGGDYFPATMQDNARGPLFGFRTMGAGGNVEVWLASSYSQGITSVTESLMSRNIDVVTSDFPVTRYVENVGVRPDIEYDYMTRQNLMGGGAAFVTAFLQAMNNQIQSANGRPAQ
jgi:hypothetical protein